MNLPEASFLTRQQQFNTEEDYLAYLKKIKWPNGFICPCCGNEHNYEISRRRLFECTY
jgi:hypothetical protein